MPMPLASLLPLRPVKWYVMPLKFSRCYTCFIVSFTFQRSLFCYAHQDQHGTETKDTLECIQWTYYSYVRTAISCNIGSDVFVCILVEFDATA